MNDTDPTLPMAHPPISSSSDMLPRDTLLQRGAFDPPAAPGTLGRLDRFEILRLIGEGGMGQVYLAREPLTDTQVAIKIMKPDAADDPREVHRFLTEARHMYRLAHPRILRVLEVSDRPAGPYYVMPYVAGGSLLARCKPGETLPETEVLAIARQVAEALAHAHAHGLIHRDLKPGNVLLDKDGNAYLTDFGLVRTLFNDSMVDATASHLEGTAPYMSPAVARGEAEDTRCDIYAFGALLYELLAGKPPYTGRTPQIILDQVLKGPPKPIREVNPKASPALARIAEGCMARELRDRYASMADVVADLDRAAKGLAPIGQHPRGRSRPTRLAALAAAALALAALAGLAVWHFGTSTPNTPSTIPGTPSSAPGVPDQTGASLSHGPFTYTVDNGAITITKYTGQGGAVTDVSIPGAINGLPVTSIGHSAFFGCGGLTRVTIPDSVISIGDNAFWGCGGLTTVTIPKSVTSIGTGAFSYCFKLTKVTLPVSVTSLGDNPFIGCASAIFVDAANPAYSSSEDGVLYNKDKTCLVAFPGGKSGSYQIPDGVSMIGNSAFYACQNLTIVTIPESVGKIDGSAFRDCGSLMGIFFNGDTPWVGNDVFQDCKNATIYYRPGTKGWGKEFAGRPTAVWEGVVPAAAEPAPLVHGPFSYMVKDGTVTIAKYTGPGGRVAIPREIDGLPVTCIGDSVFESITDMSGVDLPSTVTAIGNMAFWHCDNLVDITIPHSVTSIGDHAFFGCASISNITIPNSVARIGGGAFWGCVSLTSVEIPSSIDLLSDNAFRECLELTNVVINAGVDRIAQSVFLTCTNLTRVFFKGDAPNGGYAHPNVFTGADNVIIYYRPGTKGWGPTFAGRPTAVWEDVAAEAGKPAARTHGPFTYTIDNGAVTITKYNGPGGNVSIPSQIDGLPVTTIGDSAFLNRGDITDIEIPEGITHILGAAFFGCRSLTTVRMPKSISHVTGSTFAFCSGLISFLVDPENIAFTNSADGVLFDKGMTRIVSYPHGKVGSYVIPNGIASIGKCAFSASRLADVSIPNSITNIEDWAFDSCNLKSIALPDSVTHIGRGAFQLTGITNIMIPQSVISIAEINFAGCRHLTAIQVASDNEAYSANLDGLLFNKAKTRLVRFPAGRSGACEIPEGITTIDAAAFYNSPFVSSVTMPESLTRIGESALKLCNGLTAVYFKGDAPWAGQDVFADSTKVTIYYRPGTKGWGKEFGGRPTAVWEESGKAESTATQPTASILQPTNPAAAVTAPIPYTYTTNNGAITITKYTGPGGNVTVPATINGLPVCGFSEGNVFRDAVNLTSVSLPAGITAIDPAAFNNCPTLQSVVVDKDNPAYSGSEDGALFNKEKTRLVYCPAGKTGRYVIPNTVTNIGDWAFQPCSRLTEITISDSVRSIGFGAFYGCSKLASLTLPDSIDSIEAWAFLGCTQLTALTVPNRVVSIGNQAFYSCTGLTNMTIPASVAILGNSPFYACNALTSISVDPESTAFSSSDDGVLFNKGMTVLIQFPPGKAGGYVVPYGVSKIKTAAFDNCPYLTSAILPESVTDIGDVSFKECVNLTDIYFSGDAPRLGSDVFDGINKSATVHYRSSTKGWGPTFGGRPTAVWDVPAAAAQPSALSLQPTAALPETSIHDFACVADGDGVAVVKYTGEGGAVRIPAQVNGRPVTAIRDFAFQNASGVTEIVVPDSVTNTGYHAFRDCPQLARLTLGGMTAIPFDMFSGYTNLVSVTLPNSVTNIGSSAFRNCARLAEVAIPDQVACIGDWAFAGCASLTNVVIPDSVVTLREHAFRECTNLKHVVIGKRVAGICGETFLGCVNFESISIPASVAGITANAFLYCRSLKTIWVDVLNPVYSSSADGVLFNKEKTSLVRYPTGRAGMYTIPRTVNNIGWSAFSDCKEVTEIVIPEGVTRIEGCAFEGCDRLIQVRLPASLAEIHGSAFQYCGRLSEIVVDEANKMFCSDEKGVLFARDRTRLVGYPRGACGDYAIPESVSVIDAFAFKGSAGLTSVTIPNGIARLELETFRDCTSLTNVAIAGSVKVLDGAYWSGGVFQGCTNLPHVTIPEGVESIGYHAFENCTGLISVVIPSSVKNIGGNAFRNCFRLMDVTVPDGVVSIGDFAFYGCTNLTSVTMANSVTDMGLGVFENCANLTKVKLSDNLAMLKGEGWGGGVFMRCAKLPSFTIPDSVTSIMMAAFRECTSLSSVVVGNSVTNMDAWAFAACTNLTSVFFKGDAPNGGAADPNVFGGADKATVYHRPGTKGWGPTFGGRPTKVWKED